MARPFSLALVAAEFNFISDTPEKIIEAVPGLRIFLRLRTRNSDNPADRIITDDAGNSGKTINHESVCFPVGERAPRLRRSINRNSI